MNANKNLEATSSTSFHTNLDALPPHYGTSGQAFTAMIYLGNSDTFVCRTVNATIFDLTEFSDSSDTQYSEYSFYSQASESDSETDDMKTKNAGDYKEETLKKAVRDAESKWSKHIQQLIDRVYETEFYNQMKKIIETLKANDYKITYILGVIVFFFISIYLLCAFLYFIYEALREKTHVDLFKLCFRSTVLIIFLCLTTDVCLKIVDRKGNILKATYICLIRYHLFFYYHCYIIVIAYVFRIFIETTIRAEIRLLSGEGTWKQLFTVFGIIFICCYLSNQPQSIEYLHGWKLTLFLFAFVDRVFVTPQLAELLNQMFKVITKGGFSQYWIRQFFTMNSGLQQVFTVMLESAIFCSSMIVFHDILEWFNLKKKVFGDYGLHSTTIVTVIQFFAIFFNPLFALFFSTIFMTSLNVNEKHAVLASILSAPIGNIGDRISDLNSLKESAMTLITFPVVKILCGFIAPMTYKHGEFIHYIHVADSLSLSSFHGLRTMFLYISKILSLIVVVNLALLPTFSFIHIVISWLAYNLFGIDPAIINPINIIGMLMVPWMAAIGIADIDINSVSRHIVEYYFEYYT